MKHWFLTLCLLGSSLLAHSELFAPIIARQELKVGDEVMVVIQNGRYTSSWYAVNSKSPNNVTSIQLNCNCVETPDANCVWTIQSVNPYRFVQNSQSLLNETGGWNITAIFGVNRYMLYQATAGAQMIWRADMYGQRVSVFDAAQGDTATFDQVALKKNLTTGAAAFQILKKTYVAYFHTGQYGYVQGDSIQGPNMITNKICIPGCYAYSAGKPFIGWTLDPATRNIDFAPGDSLLLDKDVHIYAMYRENDIPSQCFDFTNLWGDFVMCHHGVGLWYPDNNWDNTISEPRTGDPYSEETHINIISSPTYQLHGLPQTIKAIPDGFENSVLLGNFKPNYGKENVEYSIRVDTADSPILLVKYLPVLEDSHAGGAGIKFYIKDEYGDTIDKYCSSFDFSMEDHTIKGEMPGNPEWRVNGDFRYHDWASIGVDLSKYQGQTVVVVIDNYDCSMGGHLGYCLYAMRCQKKQVSVYSCSSETGMLDMTAPEGFFYRWYAESNPSVVLGTEQQLSVPEGGTDSIYFCDLSTSKNFECSFTISTKLQRRYPVAYIDYDVHRGYCNDTIYLYNKSFASLDGYSEMNPHQDCDSAYWDFDGALTLSGAVPNPRQYNPPALVFTTPGEKTIKLKSCLKNWDCASDSTELKIYIHAGEAYQITYDTICLGDSFEFWGEKLTPTRPGDHTYVNVKTDVECVQELTLEEHLHVLPTYMFNESDTMCVGQAFHWRGKQLTEGGEYYDSLLTTRGCDSIYHLSLTYLPYAPSHTSIDETICEGESYWWNNKPYSETGVYTNTFLNQYGCDSVVTLNLFVRDAYGTNFNPPAEWLNPYQTITPGDKPNIWDDPYWDDEHKQDSTKPGIWDDPYWDVLVTRDTICEGEEYLWHDRIFKSQGFYTDSAQTIYGCDSLSYLYLVVNPVYNDSDKVVIDKGESYTWKGHHKDTTLTQAGIYYDSLLTIYGCDSIFVLELLVNSEKEKHILDSICEGETYPWKLAGKDTLLTQTGEYTDTLKTQTLEDSIVHLHLLVHARIIKQPIEYTACFGDSVFWVDRYVKESGIYIDTLPSQYGCDSIVQLNLTISPQAITITSDTICSGQTYTWRERTYTESVVDTILGKNAYGCVTYDILQLLVQPVLHEYDTIALGCTVDSIFWYGQYIYTPGEYSKQLTSVITFCDSIYHLNVVQGTTADTTRYDTICVGTEYLGKLYTEAGDYQFSRKFDYYGCLRKTYINLHVQDCGCLPSTSIVDTTINYTELQVDPFMWFNNPYTQPGVYTDTLRAATILGCDSAGLLILRATYKDSIIICDKDTSLFETPWGQIGLPRNITSIDTVLVKQDTIDLVYAHLAVTRLLADSTDTTAYICYYDLPFNWHGKIAQDGDTIMRTNSFGCDSIVTLHLFVSPEPISDDKDSALCKGDIIDWHGQQITMAGTYYDTARVTMPNGLKCDSIWYTLTVKENPTYNKEEDLTVCDKQLPYTWNGIVCEQAGDYVLDSVSVWGCDSIVTLHLKVDKFAASDTLATVCYNNLPFIWHGKEAKDGDTIKLVNSVGCDSIVTLRLTVSPIMQTIEKDTTVCDTLLPYKWRGHEFKQAGTYKDTVISSLTGCDSVSHVYTLYTVECKKEPTCVDSLVYRKWNDVLFCDNGQYQFVAYQWYKDAVAMQGQTKQYLYLQGGMGSSMYYVVATKADGTTVETCPKSFFERTASASTYGTIVAVASRGCRLRITVPDEEAQLVVIDVLGRLIINDNIPQQVEIDLSEGVYVISLKGATGESTRKLLVGKYD